ncbi:hypothetical protein HQN86_12610 [Pedobacter panaciterrae]|uniref:hypothetical protein n=1 Tax=Pedobacter panaciterrae TaxID=363849 RepID=UPI00155D87E0|nr:hypothetical protein [Pedobacter panaciterrae]NQX54459.1 hypothetical protein [Pedobacter panaciterrae]
MSEIKSLADQLRSSIVGNSGGKPPAKNLKLAAVQPKSKPPPKILQEILDYDSSGNKAMVHAKLDAATAKLLGHFKMATGVDNIKLVAFAVRHLFATQPELKTYIKNFIQSLEL